MGVVVVEKQRKACSRENTSFKKQTSKERHRDKQTKYLFKGEHGLKSKSDSVLLGIRTWSQMDLTCKQEEIT